MRKDDDQKLQDGRNWDQYLMDFWEDDPLEPFLPKGLWMEYRWPTNRATDSATEAANLASVGWDITAYKKKFWTKGFIRLSDHLELAKKEAWNHWQSGPPKNSPPRSERPDGYTIMDECGFHKNVYLASEETRTVGANDNHGVT